MKKIIMKCIIIAFIISIGGNFVAEAITLLYTPVEPCRIVDTRKAGGAIPPGGIRSYNVWGAVVSQGGNSAGCPSPNGEPRSVHINVTAVPEAGNGWLTAYSFGSVAPLASLVNYRSDAQNVANSGTIKTCYNCWKDISIKSGGGKTHVVIDVLGYYNYPNNFAPVPKTGQTKSYYTGDDGDLQKGVPWPDPRFTDNGDGTVNDNLTGLIWLKNADCFGLRNRSEAVGDINKLANGQCGVNDGSEAGDWRIPNIRELFSLIDHGNCYPALDTEHPFTNLQLWDEYWSSTHPVDPDGAEYMWGVEIRHGTVMSLHGGSDHAVWPVRGGND